MKNFLIFATLAIVFAYANAAHAVTFDWAQIGNAGNAGDVQRQGTFGAVAYDYAISKTEVTNAQYTEFLNSVATIDQYGLYNTNMDSSTRAGITRNGSPGSYSYAVKADAIEQGPGGTNYTYADKPVLYVSWYDSVRFTNWMHNGQGSSDTEAGAYSLLGGTAAPSNGPSVTRNTDATYWLPSEDEWYKAAYHDASAGTAGAYFDYATGNDTDPNNNLPLADSGNSANYHAGGATRNTNYPTTDAGAYSLSESPYGTFDQGGNVWEWNEALITSFRSWRGGGWGNRLAEGLAASVRIRSDPTNENGGVGFRVATLAIPEPTSLLLLLSLTSGMLLTSRR